MQHASGSVRLTCLAGLFENFFVVQTVKSLNPCATGENIQKEMDVT